MECYLPGWPSQFSSRGPPVVLGTINHCLPSLLVHTVTSLLPGATPLPRPHYIIMQEESLVHNDWNISKAWLPYRFLSKYSVGRSISKVCRKRDVNIIDLSHTWHQCVSANYSRLLKSTFVFRRALPGHALKDRGQNPTPNWLILLINYYHLSTYFFIFPCNPLGIPFPTVLFSLPSA